MRVFGRLIIVGALAAALAGCAASPTDYRSQREVPEGPGMFSGGDGGFTVIRDGRPLGGADADADADADASPGDAEFREFQRFQAYQQWKETARETGEYEEFQDWLRWQEYRRWQESR
ncbi:hypothetical protein [Sediminicurvatus halobius]|uniref:Uncharacterized protein n=1 Tax=Sediminicurvatus halobius TaxID=2182432 RepID=A0A2U2N0H4_9GAMM|nr:hypothetical protein [Spiribacter halobius]PWG62557.1 hypothetical protein DEM34_11435 [Spiribacter halobius]UEX78529.1 hypothetical protein LMH63_02480 [Spiribacter halobius]